MVMGLWDMLGWPFMALGVAFVILFVIVYLVLVILAIIDCAKRKFRNNVEKIVWILVLIFGRWIGLLVYYFVIVVYNPKGLAKK